MTNLGRGWYNVTNPSWGTNRDRDVTSNHPTPRFVTVNLILLIDYYSRTSKNIMHFKMIIFQIYSNRLNWKRWHVVGNVEVSVINNNVIKECEQSTVPQCQYGIIFPNTALLEVKFSCSRYEKNTDWRIIGKVNPILLGLMWFAAMLCMWQKNNINLYVKVWWTDRCQLHLISLFFQGDMKS